MFEKEVEEAKQIKQRSEYKNAKCAYGHKSPTLSRTNIKGGFFWRIECSICDAPIVTIFFNDDGEEIQGE